MHWTHLTAEEQLNDLLALSHDKPVIVFKHSTRCDRSSLALARLEKIPCQPGAVFYFLDLLAFPALSKGIAERLQVHHESPQVLVISNGECVYDECHLAITADEVLEQINEISSGTLQR